jgi:hypothetical protein
MDLPLLKTPFRKSVRVIAVSVAVCVPVLFAGCLFNDPLEELDPATLENAAFDTLASGENYSVARMHILESFGAYACSYCPDAELRLAPYTQSGSTAPGYNPRLVVVNYHVAFPGTLVDPWITTGTQARYNALGFSGLPQVKMNGSNARYGIREKNVLYIQGEYDSLVSRLRLDDSLTMLDLRIDTTLYDSVTRRFTVRYTLFNRSSSPRGALSLRVLVVKNRSVVIPTLPTHAWEVIVAETTDKDSSGADLALPGMAGLRSRTWVSTVTLKDETTLSPPPPNPENPEDYAVVVFVRDLKGIVQNVASRHYAPE